MNWMATSPVALGALLLALSGAACRPSATFQVLRPAQFNARDYGGTMTVQPFDGPSKAAEAVTADLRHRVRNVEGNVVTYVKSGAGLLVHGTVDEFSYVERLEQRTTSCSRAAGYGDFRYSRSFLCFEYIRRGFAHVRITFEVTAADSGQRVVRSSLEDSRHVVERRDEMRPPPIDGQRILADMRRRLTERFAKVVLPWRQEVEVSFGRCGKAREHCERGVAAIRDGELQRAVKAFRRALGQLRKSGARPRRLAEASYNLGLALEYSADFDRSERALRRAAKLDPRRLEYQAELRNVRRMQRERSELIRQGY